MQACFRVDALDVGVRGAGADVKLLGHALLRLANFTEYFWGDVLTLALTLYLLYLIDRSDKNLTRIWHKAAWTIFAAAVALLP